MVELRFGAGVWQLCYEYEILSDADRARAQLPRAPKAEKDWQVSRAVAAALRCETGNDRNTPVALSHSRGHALAGLAPTAWRLGVDLERCRPRDIDALAQWICTPDEQDFLNAVTDSAARLERFYVLWTLKESTLKAAGLTFPAGMRRVGLAFCGAASATLRVPGEGWRAMVWRLPDNWVAAAVWQADAGAANTDAIQWRQPIRPHLLGCWGSSAAEGAVVRRG